MCYWHVYVAETGRWYCARCAEGHDGDGRWYRAREGGLPADPDFQVILHALHACGAARTALQILEFAAKVGWRTAVLGVGGGGHWADEFLAAADGAEVWLGHLPDSDATTAKVVSAHHLPAIWWAIRHTRPGVRLLLHFHTQAGLDRDPAPLLTAALKREARLIFPSASCRQQYRQSVSPTEASAFDALASVLPTRPSDFAPTPATGQAGVRNTHKHVAIIARMDDDKTDFEFMTATIGKVISVVPDARFMIAGFGEKLQHAVAAVAAMPASVAARVRLLGHVKNISAVYRWADVLFLPSFTEVYPHVANEAAAFGLRLVGTDFGYSNLACEGVLLSVGRGDADTASRHIANTLRGGPLAASRFGSVDRSLSVSQWDRQLAGLLGVEGDYG